jgi:hypothetical protein
MGIAKTIAKIRQHYDFPGLRAKVKKVVDEYDTYLRLKVAYYKPYRLL